MIKIINKQGLAVDDSNLRQTLGGLLGVSIPKKLFSNELVAEIAELGTKICKKFIIVLVDYPERYNWLIRNKNSLEEAEKVFLQLGQERYRGYSQALQSRGLHNLVEIWHWKQLVKSEKYQRNKKIIFDFFFSNKSFYQDIILQVVKNVGGKIQETEKKLNRKLSKKEVEEICYYFLEELAGLFYLYFDLGYKIDIYPGPNAKLIEDIYTNKYPTLSEQLGYDWTQQGWIGVEYSKS